MQSLVGWLRNLFPLKAELSNSFLHTSHMSLFYLLDWIIKGIGWIRNMPVRGARQRHDMEETDLLVQSSNMERIWGVGLITLREMNISLLSKCWILL